MKNTARFLSLLAAVALVGVAGTPVAAAQTPSQDAMDVCVPLTNVCLWTICIPGTNVCVLCTSDCPPQGAKRLG